ncbi:hypothetical protein EMCRGX_G027809 [Ephydatia muelleri]
MNYINITWRSIGYCIGGIDKENDELLRSGLYESKGPGFSTKFYRFPSDRSQRMLWISALCYRDFVPDDTHRLCSEHLISGQILCIRTSFRAYSSCGCSK